MIRETLIINSYEKPRNCIVALAGRGIKSEHMRDICMHMHLEETLIVCFRPWQFAWYPQPNNSFDQADAVAGLPLAMKETQKAINQICTKVYGFKNKDIALVGYSAGAVVAIQLGLHAKNPFAAVVSLAGAILEPAEVPACNRTTPFILQHNRDDLCFDWEERYLPMKESLIDNGYDVRTIERHWGGHNPSGEGIINAAYYLAPALGYSDEWDHPEVIKFKKEMEQDDDDQEEREIA